MSPGTNMMDACPDKEASHQASHGVPRAHRQPEERPEGVGADDAQSAREADAAHLEASEG